MRIVSVILVLALALAACAKLQKPVLLTKGQENSVTVKASNFDFTPNHFETHQGATIVFTIENVSGSNHNFTLKDPEGKILQSVDVAPQKSVKIRAAFPRAGVYPFYCNRTFHRTMGMEGQVTVVSK